jgi:hypothetical protein
LTILTLAERGVGALHSEPFFCVRPPQIVALAPHYAMPAIYLVAITSWPVAYGLQRLTSQLEKVEFGFLVAWDVFRRDNLRMNRL